MQLDISVFTVFICKLNESITSPEYSADAILKA